MENKKKHGGFYCRLEIFVASGVILPGFIVERCFNIRDNNYYSQEKEYDVYSREFDDYGSVIDCLYEIERAWENTRKSDLIGDLGINEGASILIYNQWGIDLYLGMYNNRWLLSYVSKYTNEWKENFAITSKEEYSKTIVLRIPYYEEKDEEEFISKEKVCALTKKWLETNDDNGDFSATESIEYMEKTLGL
jgi:hypothetical protein